ncbi:MAG: outer membrane beta-barrel protein [Burkholderiales bacterium]
MPKLNRYQACSALLFASTLGLSENALSSERFYVGAGVGLSRDGSGCEVLNTATNTVVPTSSCDTSSFEGKLYAGYRFNDFVGIEIGYMGLRSTSLTLVGGGSAKFDASGIPVQAVFFLPGGSNLTWIGKLGVVRWNGKVTSDFSASQSDTGFSFVAGIGAQYDFSNNLAIRAEIEYFPKIGDEGTVGEADVTAIGVSLKFSF